MMTFIERFWARVDRRGPDDCWEWQGARNQKGYGRIATRFYNTYNAGTTTHRLSFLIHYGPIPEGLLVCHTCDNPPCVNPRHLWLGTESDNQIDSWRKGRRVSNAQKMAEARLHSDYRTPGGERAPMAKLSDHQANEIRRRWAAGERQVALAAEYGLSQPAVSNIVRGRTYPEAA